MLKASLSPTQGLCSIVAVIIILLVTLSSNQRPSYPKRFFGYRVAESQLTVTLIEDKFADYKSATSY